MGSSIFEGLSFESIGAVVTAAQNSPQGLAALCIIAVVMIAALGIAAGIAAHHIGGFYARIQEEDERLREEEEGERNACSAQTRREKTDGIQAERDEGDEFPKPIAKGREKTK